MVPGQIIRYDTSIKMLFMTIKKNTIIVITTAISGETNLEKSIILGE